MKAKDTTKKKLRIQLISRKSRNERRKHVFAAINNVFIINAILTEKKSLVKMHFKIHIKTSKLAELMCVARYSKEKAIK